MRTHSTSDSKSLEPDVFISPPHNASEAPRKPAMAVVLALAMAVPYLVLGRLGPTEAHVPGTLACLAIAFALYWFGCVENRFRLTEIQVLFLGILIRLCILPMPPSDDMHRFLWEGKIIGYGFNPFLLAPNDPAVAHLRDGNWALVNHPDLPTLYPPLAQAFFWLLAKLGSTQWPFKMGFLAFDVLGFFVLRSIARRRSAIASEAVEPLRIPAPTPRPARILAIYFLCPLLIFEIAGRGHFDSVPVFFNLLFLGSLLARKGWAPAALGLGAMTKISSLALAPLLLFALGWKRALAWGLGLAAAVGGSLWAVGAFTVLGKFATKFRFNAAMPSLLDSILPFLSGDARRNLSMALFAAVCLACLRLFRHAAPERQALWFMGLLLLFSPTLHPWYILWALPFVALTFSRPWLLLTGTVLITYEVYGRALATGHWHENPWLRLPEFLPPLSLFLWLKWKHHGTWLKGAVFSLKGRSGFPQEPSPKPLRKQEP